MFAYRHPLVKKERPTKIQVHAKAKLRRALVIADKHDVEPPDAAANLPPKGPTATEGDA